MTSVSRKNGNRVVLEIWGFKELGKPQTVGNKIEIALSDKDLSTQAWSSQDWCYEVKGNEIERGGKHQFGLDNYF